ncbi:MAG: hypothetical protein Kow002_13580 [Anaerolineales bacterium]
MKHAFSLLVCITILFAVPVKAQAAEPVITSPQTGQFVQGIVEIFGTNSLPGFRSSELAFAYTKNLTTWFLISESILETQNGLLATWDTNTLTDGDYTLRLRVTLADGSVQDIFLENVRVRNYTSLPTATPLPSTPTLSLPVPTLIPAAVTSTYPVPTPFPTNPISVSSRTIYINLGKGALLTLGLFLLFGLLLRFRRT